MLPWRSEEEETGHLFGSWEAARRTKGIPGGRDSTLHRSRHAHDCPLKGGLEWMRAELSLQRQQESLELSAMVQKDHSNSTGEGAGRRPRGP